jgi:prepilin-type processing-associated H-X9-DG protein
MYCPKCGKENLPDAQSCRFCGCSLTPAPLTARNPDVKTSWLAIVSLVLGILSLFTCGITAIPAIILGIISLVLIEKSGGKLTGLGFATIGIVTSVFTSLALILPGLQKLKMISFRMTCGTNLSGIGKAMFIYAGDYEDQLPQAGGKKSIWAAKINDWKATDRRTAFNLEADSSGGQASISSSFYLLVKLVEVTPKSFVCPGDSGTKEFNPAKYGARDRELIDFWDFGPEPTKHCSYSYHIPYGPYPLTTSSEPGMAVAADRNPWIPSPFVKAKKDFSKFDPNGTPEEQIYGNAIVHKGDGQNVLFQDGHVSFEKKSFCGVKDDNIYTFWGGSAPNWDRRKGVPPQIGSQPASRVDSLLVNDPTVANQK